MRFFFLSFSGSFCNAVMLGRGVQHLGRTPTCLSAAPPPHLSPLACELHHHPYPPP
ncbi:hypothetical protein GQ55_4G302100 [Panicum hallii var. hallii]|uniref:Uncharacterized protein n=1 Tax=Panicum hallii var. hallii TaxID=1504633 RepID=A0A2T7E1M0_9POAL|nr:hypothetical protein GQ55_4G302100 [Panicum hallii var. hallii]